jgi:beta-galactosidase
MRLLHLPVWPRKSPWFAPLVFLLFLWFSDRVWGQPYAPPVSPRTQLDISTGWKYKVDLSPALAQPGYVDTALPTVNLPHTWNALDGQDGGNNYEAGQGHWYRKRLLVPASFAGKEVFLQFDGVNQIANVYVNGTSVGSHTGGYSRFRLRITPHIQPGQANVIAVNVTSFRSGTSPFPPRGADYTFFGGIYRQVWLLATDPVQVDMLDYGSPGVYLTPKNVTAASADLEVRTLLRNYTGASQYVTVRTTITDADLNAITQVAASQYCNANVVSTVTQNITVQNPRLWRGRADPYQYRAFVTVEYAGKVADTVDQRFGFRKFEISADTGFKMNDTPLRLHGVSRHQDRRDMGWAIGAAQEEQDMELILEMGCNTVRAAHYQQSENWYDLCDANGLVVWAEIPVVNLIYNTNQYLANARQQLQELIRQNYNRPSIFCWGLANEISGSQAQMTTAINTLNNDAHNEDPTRPSGIANYHTTPSHALIPDITGINMYWGWYEGTAADFASKIDALRAANPLQPLGITEYGAGSNPWQHQNPPVQPVQNGPFHPEEYESAFHETYWKAIEARPYLYGSWLWNMFDFAADHRNEGSQAGLNDKGMVTHNRVIRKDVFYWYKANWSDEPVVHINSRRATNRATTGAEVRVYSNCDQVELFLDGVSQGALTSTDHIYSFPNLVIANGTRVEAIGTRGGETFRDAITWNQPWLPEVTTLGAGADVIGALSTDAPGPRLVVDLNRKVRLPAGDYELASVSYNANVTGGAMIRPFLATKVGANSYKVIVATLPLPAIGGGYVNSTYASPNLFRFTLTEESDVFPGFYQSERAQVKYATGGSTATLINPAAAPMVGNTLTTTGTGGVTYAFSLGVRVAVGPLPTGHPANPIVPTLPAPSPGGILADLFR